MHPVYEPREDSFFLQKRVVEEARGRVLDMGTGSGVQAIAAAKKDEVSEVVAVDINPAAISYAREHNNHEKIFYKESDMFEKVKGKFDTIIFNAPYLPNDEEIADIALDGGPTGLEVSTRFITQAEDYLADEGIILILLSDHTDLTFFERFCDGAGYTATPIDHLKIDFETLYIYRLTR